MYMNTSTYIYIYRERDKQIYIYIYQKHIKQHIKQASCLDCVSNSAECSTGEQPCSSMNSPQPFRKERPLMKTLFFIGFSIQISI